jgi:hypothetical protein
MKSLARSLARSLAIARSLARHRSLVARTLELLIRQNLF